MAAAVALLAATSAVAQAQDTQPSTQQMMQELNALKESMKAKIQELEDKIQAANTAAAAAKAQSDAAKAQSDAAQAQSDAAKKEADVTAAKTADAVKVSEKLSRGRLQIGHTNIFFNGWVEGSMGYRRHDEIAGPSQTSVLSPYPIQAQYGAQEFEAGPPQTRFGMNTISDESHNLILRSKLEFDLLSGSNAANRTPSGAPLREGMISRTTRMDSGFAGCFPSRAPSVTSHQQDMPSSRKEIRSTISSRISARAREPLMSSRMRLRRCSIWARR